METVADTAMAMMSDFSHHCDKIPNRNNLEEDVFQLMVSEGFSTWPLSPMHLAEHHSNGVVEECLNSRNREGKDLETPV